MLRNLLPFFCSPRRNFPETSPFSATWLKKKWRPVLILVGLLGAMGSSAVAGTTVYVGSPSNPGALSAAIQSAYAGGATTIIVNTGTYTFAAANDAVLINGWSNATVSCYGCTFVDTDTVSSDSMWAMTNCTNVTLAGGTFTCSYLSMSESPITSLGGVDGSGYQTYNVSTPAGYPTLKTGTGNQFCDVVDGESLQYEIGTGDFYKATVTSQGGGAFNVDFNQACPKLAVGDFIVSRALTMCGYKIYMNRCTNCMLTGVTLSRNGFANLREDICSGSVFQNITWAVGPAPTGGTKVPIFSCGADGTDAIYDSVGPTFENCHFYGLLNDDDIAIHGYAWPITSVSGSTITIADSSFGGDPHPVSGDPLQLFNATFYGQGTMSSVSDNGTTTTVVVSGITSIPTSCIASDPNHCGAGYKILNCYIGSTRSRGIIAKASNGLIQGNTIFNPGIAGILVGYEGYASTEGGYVSNVSILDNFIDGCAQEQPGISYGAIYVAPPGAQGNSNILIENNIMASVSGVSIYVTGTNGANVAYNTFANTAEFVNDYHLANIINSNGIAFTNNLLTNRGANTATTWYEYNAASTNLTGLNSSGLSTGMYSSGIYLMEHQGTGEFIDVPNNSQNSLTGLVQYSYLGTDEQLWVPVNLLNGHYTLGHLGTNLIMDDPGGNAAPGTQVDQYPYNTSNNDSWTITDQGNGTQKVINLNSSLALDAYGNNGNNNAIIDLATPTGSSGQSWAMDFISAGNGPNLVQNSSFEANGGYTTHPTSWTVSGSAYVQAGISTAEDGNYNMVFYYTSPWTASGSQTITGLTNGIYSATAYVEDASGLSQAYMFANNYGGSQLTANAPNGTGGGLGGWVKITIPCINVTNGQCVVGFYAQDTVGNKPIYIDNVQLFRQF